VIKTQHLLHGNAFILKISGLCLLHGN
jgi:hypothetical protein